MAGSFLKHHRGQVHEAYPELSQGVGHTEERTFPRGEGAMSLLESSLGPRQAPVFTLGS